MTEPTSTGIGGDMFILFWDASTKTVKAMNGSGRAGANCTLSKVRGDLGIKDGESGSIPMTSVHAATVPGAPAGWVDTHEKFGSDKVNMSDILAPAIKLGENGFPVSEIAAHYVCNPSSEKPPADETVGILRGPPPRRLAQLCGNVEERPFCKRRR